MSKVFTLRDVTVRLVDGAGTPYYLELKHDTDVSFPIGRKLTEEILKMHRGKMSADALYIEGGHDPIMEPLDISINVEMTDKDLFGYILDWIEGNTVNGNTITTTKGTTQNVSGVSNPAFADSGKKTSNVEVKLDGATDIVWKLAEVYFPLDEIQHTEGEEGNSITLSGKLFGTVTRGTSFTSGNDVTV